jgi:hypothetical protein
MLDYFVDKNQMEFLNKCGMVSLCIIGGTLLLNVSLFKGLIFLLAIGRYLVLTRVFDHQCSS